MCSVEDGNETVELKPKAKSLCRRCNEKAVAVHGKDSFCCSCFLAYCIHKFRGTLGKSKQIKRGEKILVAFSGGMSSSAMLYMIKEGLKEASHKRLCFCPVLLFIDESSIFSTPCDGDEDNKEIYKIMLDSDFPSYITRLEMIYHDEKSVFYQPLDSTSYSNLINNNKEKKTLIEALDSFKSLSSKENFIKNLRYNLILDIARSIDCSKIFVGESATRLSIRLLANLAQGRGANIADETSFVDGRYAIPILRPLREFLSKEIAMYNHFLTIPYQVKQTLSTKLNNKASILRLTENFVVGLQSQFPATVSTIYRIGNKLCADSGRISKDKCILCQSFIDTTNTEECSALKALQLSERLCQKLENSASTSVDSCQQSSNKCCMRTTNVDCSLESRIESFQYLCYSCQIVVKDMNNQNLLPSSIKQKLSRCQMKEKFKEYLLDDDDDDD